MKKLTLFGKINFGLGMIFFILGIFLFIQKIKEELLFEEQHLLLSFVCLGIALFLASYLTTKNKGEKEESRF